MDQYKKSFVLNALSRATYKWKGRWEAEKLSKLDGRNQYKCAMCPEGTIHPKKDTQMDHIQPKIDPEKGWQGFTDEMIDRMFPYKEGWQRLCKEHHAQKTASENVIRKESRSNTKKKVAKKVPKKK